jgi:hypothetical protein
MRVLLVGVPLALAAACAEGAGPGAPSSGIAGRVVLFPTCPVEMEGAPCPRKGVRTTVVAEAADGERVVHVTTESDGSFRMDLRPGDYLVTARAPATDPHLVPRPTAATVEPGTYSRVTVVLDTRLREP